MNRCNQCGAEVKDSRLSSFDEFVFCQDCAVLYTIYKFVYNYQHCDSFPLQSFNDIIHKIKIENDFVNAKLYDFK
jgi:hypothetical protein